ncbi:MAG: flagellar basal body-associated FliL family protein [Acuticoccus sp.]
MEDDEQQAGEAAATPKPAAGTGKGGMMGLIVALAVSTALGAGGGAVLAMNQVDAIANVERKKANEVPDKVDDALAWRAETSVIDLEPVIANLAAPQDMWIRLEMAVVFDEKKVSDVARLEAEITGDVLEFVRTVEASELRGASGLNHLRDDLNERIRFKTAGAVEELIIEAMVLQ